MKKNRTDLVRLPSSEPARNEIVVYQPDETMRLDVRLENETVWLTQGQMTDLFCRGNVSGLREAAVSEW